MSDNPQKRLIQSFGRRKGRPFTKEKQKLLADILPDIEITLPDALSDKNDLPNKNALSDKKNIDPKIFFESSKSPVGKSSIENKQVWLEIGFGDGEHLFHNVNENSDILMIGGEVYFHGIASLLKKISINEFVKNRTRIFADDIRLLLSQLESNSLDKIFVLFPDPWPKKKQNKRRLLNADFLTELSRVMKKDAILHIATDHHEYAEFILQNMFASECFVWTAKSKNDWLIPNPYHIETKYQIKNKAATDYPVFLNFQNT